MTGKGMGERRTGRADGRARALGVPLVLLATLAGVSATGLALAAPTALERMERRTERLANTALSDAILGQFTPASGDPRLIARYARLSAEARARFSFTPVREPDAAPRESITVVVRAKPAGAGAIAPPARRLAAAVPVPTAATAPGAGAPVAIAPVAYNLGKSVGFDRFKTATAVRRAAAPAPVAAVPVLPVSPDALRPAKLRSRLVAEPTDPIGASPRALEPDAAPAVGLNSSYRLTRNIDVTAGVRYDRDGRRLLPADPRRDGQAIYVGTQFRF